MSRNGKDRYRYENKKYGIPIEFLKRDFEDELSGKVPMDQPLEIPDKMEVVYKYSYGGQSRFFREIRENKRIYGGKCPQCGKVYCPPRAHCSLCYQPTNGCLANFREMNTFTVQYLSTSAFIKKVPFFCVYVQLDGTDFLLMANMEVNNVARSRWGPGSRPYSGKNGRGPLRIFILSRWNDQKTV